ncbi:MAG: 2-oxo acid dehydrogenase subunit E2, partial [Gammaproteobacteria bacterium]
AAIDVPSPETGKIESIKVKVGDKVSEGSVILTLSPVEAGAAPAEPSSLAGPGPATESAPRVAANAPPLTQQEATTAPNAVPAPPSTLPPPVQRAGDALPHASPSVRRFARELGVDLSQVRGSGIKGRILRENVQAFVKGRLAGSGDAARAPGALAMPAMPQIDFSKFGDIETAPLSRIKKLAGANLHRNWITVPHVTQHDEADITELENFRQELKKEAAARDVRLTPLAFFLKASAVALREFPNFNASLDASGENLILKKYFHIGFAVDTPDGLVVPVIRDVDKKGIFDLAMELGALSVKAREKKLGPADMQGGCFSISSLGGIGGSFFTPIINAPEVAILGIARSKLQPVYQYSELMPRLILPLSLSYDHRVIDGADAARFITYLSGVLTDVRRLLI